MQHKVFVFGSPSEKALEHLYLGEDFLFYLKYFCQDWYSQGDI